MNFFGCIDSKMKVVHQNKVVVSLDDIVDGETGKMFIKIKMADQKINCVSDVR